jgi:hypothetical protein
MLRHFLRIDVHQESILSTSHLSYCQRPQSNYKRSLWNYNRIFILPSRGDFFFIVIIHTKHAPYAKVTLMENPEDESFPTERAAAIEDVSSSAGSENERRGFPPIARISVRICS